MNEHADLDMYNALQEMTDAVINGVCKIADVICKTAATLTLTLSPYFEEMRASIVALLHDQWTKAEIWAENTHPEWVTIYYRTKKARIRKKYRDRIMRAYIKEASENCGTNKDGGAGEF